MIKIRIAKETIKIPRTNSERENEKEIVKETVIVIAIEKETKEAIVTETTVIVIVTRVAIARMIVADDYIRQSFTN